MAKENKKLKKSVLIILELFIIFLLLLIFGKDIINSISIIFAPVILFCFAFGISKEDTMNIVNTIVIIPVIIFAVIYLISTLISNIINKD